LPIVDTVLQFFASVFVTLRTILVAVNCATHCSALSCQESVYYAAIH